jgi:methionyl-tRNA formyltransferase
MSYFTIGDKNVKVWQATAQTESCTADVGTIMRADKSGIQIATAKGSLILEQIQIPGKKAMSVSDVLNSRADWFEVGSQLALKSL